MFTGIVEGVGIVADIERSTEFARLTISAPSTLTGIALGDSISVNGACLTVVEITDRYFRTEVSQETLTRTNLGLLKPTDAVNLERAIRLGDRLGGHLVTGHVDGQGSVAEMVRAAGSLVMTISVSPEIYSQLVEKGSVAVEGVSLTVNEVRGNQFVVNIVPYTAENTTLARKRIGDRVNIEVDIIGKYVKRFLGKGEGIDAQFLVEHGFL